MHWFLQFSIVNIENPAIIIYFFFDEIPTTPIILMVFTEVLPWQRRKNTAAQCVPGG